MTSVSPMKLALFDLDNTLFDRAAPQSVGRVVGRDERDSDRPKSSGSVKWTRTDTQIGRTVWINAKAKFGLPEPVDDLLASQRSAYLDTCRPDDTVLEALVSLRLSGWRIEIVTNGAMPHRLKRPTAWVCFRSWTPSVDRGNSVSRSLTGASLTRPSSAVRGAKLLIGKLAGWLEMRPFPTSRAVERSVCARSGSTGDANGTPAMGIPRT